MAKTTKLTLHPKFTIGEISPRLYGAFLEPIGTMVNGSMYNPKHPTADSQGFRQDFIAALREAEGDVDEAALMEEHRFVYASTFAPDKFRRYVRIPFDPNGTPGERVSWQQ